MRSTRATARIAAYAVCVICGLAAALAAGRPEPAALAAPFATYLVLALLEPVPPVPRVRVRVSNDRCVEGDEVTLTVIVDPPDAEVLAQLPAGIDEGEVTATADGIRMQLRTEEWGVYDVGHVAARSFDGQRGWMTTAQLHAQLKLRVYPRADRLPRRLVAAEELQPFVGQHPSRARGDGFEFADLRPYRAGDRARSVNWRATVRRGAVWVNDRHPERTTNVVVMLDTFGTEGRGRNRRFEVAVRAIAGLAEAYGRTQDRIGLLTFGGHLRWVDVSGGRRQVMRIVDALLDTEALLTETWAGVPRVPVGAIPPRSLLLAVTPLDNDTAVDTLVDLRGRGFDVAVIATGDPGATAAPSGERRSDDPAAGLGARLDALLIGTRRLRLERLGIVVAHLDDSLAATVRELDERRRRLARVRA